MPYAGNVTKQPKTISATIKKELLNLNAIIKTSQPLTAGALLVSNNNCDEFIECTVWLEDTNYKKNSCVVSNGAVYKALNDTSANVENSDTWEAMSNVKFGVLNDLVARDGERANVLVAGVVVLPTLDSATKFRLMQDSIIIQ